MAFPCNLINFCVHWLYRMNERTAYCALKLYSKCYASIQTEHIAITLIEIYDCNDKCHIKRTLECIINFNLIKLLNNENVIS